MFSFNTSGTQTFLSFFLSPQEQEQTFSAVSVHQSFVIPANSHHMEMRNKEKILEITF